MGYIAYSFLGPLRQDQRRYQSTTNSSRFISCLALSHFLNSDAQGTSAGNVDHGEGVRPPFSQAKIPCHYCLPHRSVQSSDLSALEDRLHRFTFFQPREDSWGGCLSALFTGSRPPIKLWAACAADAPDPFSPGWSTSQVLYLTNQLMNAMDMVR